MKIISSIVAATSLLALAALIAIASPTQAADEVNNCPASTSSFLDPWLLVSAGDGSVRPADRDGDGFACIARLVVRDTWLLQVATDNAIGNPNVIPPGPCTGPFARLSVGNPGLAVLIGNPGIREIDANGDGVLCGASRLETRGLIIILLDNPNALPR